MCAAVKPYFSRTSLALPDSPNVSFTAIGVTGVGTLDLALTSATNENNPPITECSSHV